MADFNQTPADGALAVTLPSLTVGVASNGALGASSVTIYNFPEPSGRLAVTSPSFAIGVASNGANGYIEAGYETFAAPSGTLSIRLGAVVQVLDDLLDVIITNPATLDRLVYDGEFWRNTPPS